MAESVQEAVRVPSGLAEYIDKQFVETGKFSSRADFVSSAIRYHYENSLYHFALYANLARKIRQEDPELASRFKSSLTFIKMMFLNTKRIHRVESFDGKKITVLLRLPPTFVKSYDRFINETKIYKNKSEFFNHALEAYLDGQFLIGSIMESIHTRDVASLLMTVGEPDFNEKRPLESATPLSDPDKWVLYSTRETEKEDWLDE